MKDGTSDLLDILGIRPAQKRLPPAHLRCRVAGTSSRKAFLESGFSAARDVARTFSLCRDIGRSYSRWLDFGCGCGRVARHLVELPEAGQFSGVDVDREQVAWCRKHLRGEYATIASVPPTHLPGESFDVVYSGSVFTHLDEVAQLAWLSEIHRCLEPGGLFIASTHSPDLVWTRPDLSPAQREELDARGFLFAPGSLGFNEDTAFHSREYLLAKWGALLGLRRYECFGLNGYQDLHVWVKWD